MHLNIFYIIKPLTFRIVMCDILGLWLRVSFVEKRLAVQAFIAAVNIAGNGGSYVITCLQWKDLYGPLKGAFVRLFSWKYFMDFSCMGENDCNTKDLICYKGHSKT